MSQGMETFEARLASFDTILNPGKRRGSGAKSIKPITWPHNSPSPAELAHAGFYYEPHETNPDNTRCFLCESALDGWEEEDNPITEHLTLSQNCGWAIMMDIQRHTSNPAEIEDPTSDRIVQARTATFGLFWPHDGKRGWVCQSEKMVAGGWYFCANEESSDLASCAYCKLSLDGWEPKDDPYEEHYRRSSDCSFFVFAQHPSKKTKSSRSKKPKSSKASSRLSTLSTASEAPTDDFDDQMDQSIMSDTSTKPKNTKKSAKSRSRASKSKKADTEGTGEPMDMDDTEDASPEPPKPKRATRGKKRTSDQAGQGDFDGTDIEATEAPAPAPKKRATRTRGSASRQNSVDIDDVTSIASHDEAASLEGEPKKGRRTTKKASSTRGRKASGASSTKAPSKSRVPDDEELDAALEADLEQDVHDYEEQPAEKSTKQASKKPKSNKKSKTETKALVDTTDVPTGHAERPEDRAEEVPETDEVESVGTGSRAQALPEEREDTEAAVPGRHESVASAGIATNDSGQRSEAEPIDEVKTKKSKKTSADKTKKLKKTSKQPEKVSGPKGDPIEDVEDAPEEEPAEADIDMPDQKEALEPSVAKEEEQVEDRSSRRRSSNHPPKTIERYSDMPHEQQFAKSLTESQGSGAHDESNNTRHTDRQADGAISPIPSAPKSTPSLSPQSSDAENQPPSTKASATRDHTPLPSKQPSVGAPLAANTPSPSKRNVNAGGLKSSQPWTPIDIEAILFGAGSEKENSGRPIGELSSAEKQMTVEEWIQWQAKNGEERLRQECERLVSHFEKEGGRAMRVLESIECID